MNSASTAHGRTPLRAARHCHRPDEPAAEVERVRPQALDHGAPEYLLQVAAVNGELRQG